MGSAGSPGSSGSKKSNGTLGQPTAIGTGAGGDNSVFAGFWKSGYLATVTGSDIPDISRTELYQNYPNPFNPSTTIEYSLAVDGPVALIVYNVAGQRIRTLVNDIQLSGRYSENWDGRNDRGSIVATGIYFCRLRAGSKDIVKKMILLR